MSSRYSIYSLIILSFAITTFCERSDQTNIGNTIEVGNPTNLIIQHIDTVIIAGIYDRQSILIDLDLDGLDDIEISGIVTGSTGLGHTPSAEIACLNSNTFVSLINSIDTTFLDIDTNIYIQNGITFINYTKRFRCSRTTPNDSIYRIIEKDHIRVLSKSEMISTNDFWANDTIKLNYYIAGSPSYNVEYESMDTIIRTYVGSSYFNCRGFPNDQVGYVGIMISSPETMRLGYIKIHITNYIQITIFEFALQK